MLYTIILALIINTGVMTPPMMEAQEAYHAKINAERIEEVHVLNGPYANERSDDEYEPIPYSALYLIEPTLEGQLTERQMVDLIAQYFPKEWHNWALNVSYCESRWNTDAKNTSSTATGLWQFLRSTWDWVSEHTGTASYDSGAPYDARANARNAAWLVQNGGPSHWVCKSAK